MYSKDKYIKSLEEKNRGNTYHKNSHKKDSVGFLTSDKDEYLITLQVLVNQEAIKICICT